MPSVSNDRNSALCTHTRPDRNYIKHLQIMLSAPRLLLAFLIFFVSCKKSEDSNLIYTPNDQINLKTFIDFIGSNYYLVKDRTSSERRLEENTTSGAHLKLFLKNGLEAQIAASYSIVRSVVIYSDTTFSKEQSLALYNEYYAYLNARYSAFTKRITYPDLLSFHSLEDPSKDESQSEDFRTSTWLDGGKLIRLDYKTGEISVHISSAQAYNGKDRSSGQGVRSELTYAEENNPGDFTKSHP